MTTLYGCTYCDGPNGKGIERSCGKSCLNFCNSKSTLIDGIEYVLEKWGLSEQECQTIRDTAKKIK